MDTKGQVRAMADYQKAFIGPYVNGHMELKGRFYVPFNPAEISIEEAIGIADISQVDGREKRRGMAQGSHLGRQYPMKKSSHRRTRGMTRLSVKLFFNTLNDLHQTSYRDVREDIRKLYPYTNTTERITQTGSKTKDKTNKAQMLYFFWGSIAVAGMLSQMSVTYTMFAPDGKPVRAEVSISIEGFYVGEETGEESKAAGAGQGGGQKRNSAASSEASPAASWRENHQGSGNPRL